MQMHIYERKKKSAFYLATKTMDDPYKNIINVLIIKKQWITYERK